MTGQFLAMRPGDGRTFVIPAAWARNYQARGWRVHPAPKDLPMVRQPTPLDRVKRAMLEQAPEAPEPVLEQAPELEGEHPWRGLEPSPPIPWSAPRDCAGEVTEEARPPCAADDVASPASFPEGALRWSQEDPPDGASTHLSGVAEDPDPEESPDAPGAEGAPKRKRKRKRKGAD